MRPLRPFLLAAVSLLVASACAVEPVPVQLAGDEPADSPDRPSALGESSSALAAVAVTGELVVVDPAEGRVLARAPRAAGELVDLAAIGGSSVRLAARTIEDVESAGGALGFVGAPPGSAALAWEPVGWIEGATRLVGSPFGAIVVQDDMGQRWRLVRGGGELLPSLACGRPLSVRTVRSTAGATWIEALSLWPEGVPASLHVLVEPTGIAACRVLRLEGAEGASPSVRMVELGLGFARALVDAPHRRVEVAALDGAEVASAIEVPFEVGRVEAAERVSVAPDRAIVAVLTSDPSSLLTVDVRLDADGALRLAGHHVFPLQGEVEPAEGFLSRDLVVIGRSVFAATSQGVAAFSVSPSGALAPKPFFTGARVRGPLAVVPR